jgi:hypothetical protein
MEGLAMPSAEETATQLAHEFLRMGRYSASSGPVDIPEFRVMAAGAEDVEISTYASQAEGFSGLAVQSVGFEEGSKDPAVHIYLTRRVSRQQLKSLPKEVDGVPVKVHKMEPITVPEAMASSTNRGNIFELGDRVCCGSSCGPTSERGAGTLGAIVGIGARRDLYLLSNNHVLSGCNHVPHNQPILAPASMDGRPDAVAPHEIGRHHMLHELRSGNPHFVAPGGIDLALGRVSNQSAVSSWEGDRADGYDTPSAISEPASLQRVKKVGRTTGLTFGEVEAHINTPTPITYNAKHFKGTVWFKDIWTVRALDGEQFVLPGDSGSLVVSEDGHSAVGVVFAGNPSGDYGWIIPMPAATAVFGGLNLVSGHGV